MFGLPVEIPDRVVASAGAGLRVDGIEMPYGGADDDCFVSVPGLVDRDSLSLDSTWIPVLVECPCDTRGCIWLFAHDECLHHFHFSGFFWRNSTISLVVLPVPCSLATRWRKSGSRRLPYAFAHASYAFFTLSRALRRSPPLPRVQSMLISALFC